ncbi:unnamed protein product, partial [Amoebophrya sp. A25]
QHFTWGEKRRVVQVAKPLMEGDIPAGRPYEMSKESMYKDTDNSGYGSPRSRSPSVASTSRRAQQNTRFKSHDPFEGRNARDDFQVQMFAGPGSQFGPGLFAGLGVYSSPKRKEIVQRELQMALAQQMQEKQFRKQIEQQRERQEQEALDRRIALEREDIVRKYEEEQEGKRDTGGRGE